MSSGAFSSEACAGRCSAPGNPRLFENGYPLFVNGRALSWRATAGVVGHVAGARVFEGPKFEGSLVDFRQRERAKGFGCCRQELLRADVTVRSDRAGLIPSRRYNGLVPLVPPFEQEHTICLFNSTC